MAETQLQDVAQAVLRRAQRQGFILPRQVREELTAVGVSGDLWKDVIELVKGSLHFRQGKYYFQPALGTQTEETKQRSDVLQQTVREMIRQYKEEAAQTERRHQGRTDFIKPVQLETEDGRKMTLLCRDISTTGLRLIGTRSLLGQKIRVSIPMDANGIVRCFLVRILWTCAVGDELFENGGNFLEMFQQA